MLNNISESFNHEKMSFLSSLEVLNIQHYIRIYLFRQWITTPFRQVGKRSFLIHEAKMVERQGHTACFLLFGPVLCICRVELCTHTIDKRIKLSRAGAIPLIRHEMKRLKFLTSLNIKAIHIFLSNIHASWGHVAPLIIFFQLSVLWRLQLSSWLIL